MKKRTTAPKNTDIKVKHIYHSGFLMGFPEACFLFDYYKGEIGDLDASKELYIFVSHKHQDHYNYDIWDLRKKYKKVFYIISKDVPFNQNAKEKIGLTEEECSRVLRAYSLKEYSLQTDLGKEIKIETLRSTDCGVAYIVEYDGISMYHGGDLNLWIDENTSSGAAKDMMNRYREQLEYIKGRHFDMACVPVDPVLGKYATMGREIFLEYVSVDKLYPMHYLDKDLSALGLV